MKVKRSIRRPSGLTPKAKFGKEDIGENPKDFITTVSKTRNLTARQSQFDGVMGNSRIEMAAFLEKRDKDGSRLPIPVIDRLRVKLSTKIAGDKDYYNATYFTANEEDFIIAQGPNFANVGQFWRIVYTNGCQLIICTVEDKSFSDTERSKCFNFFPREENKSQNFLNGRFTVKCLKKQGQKGFAVYEILLTSTDPMPKKDKDDPESGAAVSEAQDDKNKTISLIHIYDWKLDQWPDLEMLYSALQMVLAKEDAIFKKAADSFIPPVICMGLNAIQRPCAMSLWITLMKQCEHRDSFDIETLIRNMIRVRPGAFTDKLTFFLVYAMGFKMAAKAGWLTTEDGKQRVAEIEEGYKKISK
ncbi:unnamed protein product [Bursaphelenchus xylophilus]|uniref:(pine wood nematode) hypothetical protein n=1 Tax=Bursaphelenchus xylophilus TaxID=6326 RepID=A0A1I7SLP3_BURXY|nr:unnamed protein product [Bursaphelenchus xylophilus]CAG9129691.1 unnamed protein product [Bursaphelenchus xylophilus]